MTKTLTPKELAIELGTDARTCRKFLRSTLPDAAPGKGARWAIEAKQVRSLKSKFVKWEIERAAAAANAKGDDEVTEGDDAPETDAPEVEEDAEGEDDTESSDPEVTD